MGKPVKLVIGQKYGRLVILRELTPDKNGRRVACRCDCGIEKLVNFKMLRTGNTSSCGCLRSEMVAAKNTTHGLTDYPEYGHWKGMRQRCNDPNHAKYKDYGEKGIIVCERWNDFALFIEDVGRMPSEQHSLDRFPNRHGNYEPGNVRWATAVEQSKNRDCTFMVTFRGVEMSLTELSKLTRMPYNNLYDRLTHGWSVERAVTTPITVGNNQYGTH